jgi:hypothetical protein
MSADTIILIARFPVATKLASGPDFEYRLAKWKFSALPISWFATNIPEILDNEGFREMFKNSKIYTSYRSAYGQAQRIASKTYVEHGIKLLRFPRSWDCFPTL